MDGAAVGSLERRRFSLLFWVFYFLGGAWLALLVWACFGVGFLHGLKALGVALGFAVVAPIIWAISDWLRLTAMPTMFFSNGFIDTLGKKLFWAVGPQAIGMCLAIVGSTWLIFQVAPPPSKASTTQVATTTSSKPETAPPAHPSQRQELNQADVAEPVASTRLANSPVTCVGPQVLKSLKASLVSGMQYRAKAKSGRVLSVDRIESESVISITDIKPARNQMEGQMVCTATLSVEVSPGLMDAGLDSAITETSFYVYKRASGEVEADFGE